MNINRHLIHFSLSALALLALLAVIPSIVQAEGPAVIIYEFENGQSLARTEDGQMVLLGKLCESDVALNVSEALRDGEQQTDLPGGGCFWNCGQDCGSPTICTAGKPDQEHFCVCRYIIQGKPNPGGDAE